MRYRIQLLALFLANWVLFSLAAALPGGATPF